LYDRVIFVLIIISVVPYNEILYSPSSKFKNCLRCIDIISDNIYNVQNTSDSKNEWTKHIPMTIDKQYVLRTKYCCHTVKSLYVFINFTISILAHFFSIMRFFKFLFLEFLNIHKTIFLISRHILYCVRLRSCGDTKLIDF